MHIELNWFDIGAIFQFFLVLQSCGQVFFFFLYIIFWLPVALRRRMHDALITWRWDKEGWKLNFAPLRLKDFAALIGDKGH